MPSPPAGAFPWDRRDPERIRRLMPLLGWFHRHYFRVQTSGWEHVPPAGPMLVVGSHNGGLASPDLAMTFYDWHRRFGFDRRVYGLTHAKLWAGYPWIAGQVAAIGGIPFHGRKAMVVLERGDGLLVYPGGGQDAFRPHRQRGRIQFAGRTGFLRLAIRQGVPIVPLISWGAHDTLLVIDDLYPLARAVHRLGVPWPLGIDPEVLPLYLGLPWGLALGPVPNLPLPVPIHTRVCAPIHLARSGLAASRDRDYVQECYRLVTGTMQAELDRLRAEKI
jgi:1-acyl-sn-glycerol-3-phosphate acyltransferase